MAQKRSAVASRDVAKVRTRIDGWRRARKKRCRMPEELWLAAAELARGHGVNPIAEALNLNYYGLKRRVAESAKEGTPAGPVFVEVPRPLPMPPSACVVELAHPDGAKMTIRMDAGRDLVALSQLFWSRRP